MAQTFACTGVTCWTPRCNYLTNCFFSFHMAFRRQRRVWLSLLSWVTFFSPDMLATQNHTPGFCKIARTESGRFCFSMWGLLGTVTVFFFLAPVFGLASIVNWSKKTSSTFPTLSHPEIVWQHGWNFEWIRAGQAGLDLTLFHESCSSKPTRT